jgi:hypothetical protein
MLYLVALIVCPARLNLRLQPATPKDYPLQNSYLHTRIEDFAAIIPFSCRQAFRQLHATRSNFKNLLIEILSGKKVLAAIQTKP